MSRHSLVAVVTLSASIFAACQPSPGAPVESVVGDRVSVVFVVGSGPQPYVGFGTADMQIDDDDLTRIGTASEADSTLFPDRSVFALAGVDPRDAIVLVDKSTEEDALVLFTRDGVSPVGVPGVCAYYVAPEGVGCS